MLYRQLGEALKQRFGTAFHDNSNSFDSCFQFVAQEKIGLHDVRVKYYCKTMELIQSESVMKSLGSNLKGIYYSNVLMGRALQESVMVGLTRIELTYGATTLEGEAELFDELFPDIAEINLNQAFLALQSVQELGWHLSLKELLDTFV